MKKIFVFILSLCAYIGMQAQPIGASHYDVLERYPRSAVYFELMGNSPTYSFNYDCRFSVKKSDGWGARVGVGVYSSGSDTFTGHVTCLNVPLGLNYLVGRDGKYLELGAGFTYLYRTKYQEEVSEVAFRNIDKSLWIGTLIIAYRYQPVGGGVFFRVGITPILNFKKDEYSMFNTLIMPLWAGIAVGFTF
ncbi:MAG: hypothetical protein LBT48_00085 [Prevotellaceae bacterium]|jgi:hypothetical protein|nr:hypothetical protein [Prevotellaceae bacterium]